MLLHYSLSARDPGRVAAVLAELLGATVVACPSPPFPSGARYVCFGDDRGSMVEVIPAGFAYAPGPKASPRVLPVDGDAPTASHALLLAAVAQDKIEAVAAREGWPSAVVDTGLFKVVALWLEGQTLVELTTKELLPSYASTYDREGLTTLDAKLRTVEAQIAKMTGAH